MKKIDTKWQNEMPQSCDLMIHSSIKSIGLKLDIEEFIWQLINSIGGLNVSTVLMPTFTFLFTETKYYNPDTSPSEAGLLTEAFRLMDFQGRKAIRTLNPMQSVAVVGKNDTMYTSISSKCSTTFGDSSIFDLMLKQDAYCVLIGVDYDKCTFYHYLEEKFQVPFRFWKAFDGVIELNGKREKVNFKNFIRYLQYETNINHYGLLLEERGLVKKINIGNAISRLFKVKDLYDLLSQEVQRDPFCLTNTQESFWQIKTTLDN